MSIPEPLQALHADMIEWRRYLHAHPEIAYEEQTAARLVSDKLTEFGLEVATGWAKTGVVGTLCCGNSDRAIGLRADMDALPMTEKNTFEHASQNPGRMHACGHDGHTTMLLGAAAYLAEHQGFDGTVHFIFQPAEEGGGGGDVMVKQGLFEQFPVDAVYGMHNWPGLAAGTFGIIDGPIMGSADTFEINVTGQGCHAAMPNLGRDPFLAVRQLLGELQAVPARRFAATDNLIVSVTQVHGGSAFNVIPDEVKIIGTVRTLSETVRQSIEPIFNEIAAGIGQGTGCRIDVNYDYGYPVTVNHTAQTQRAAQAAWTTVGPARVEQALQPSLAGEDFAFMLQARPGCYVWIGNGQDSASLHNTAYDFNDDILPIGAAYWARLVQQELPTK